jgi:hypothetical protein
MPYNPITGIYSLPTGNNPPFPGQLISTNTLTLIVDDIANALNNIPPTTAASLKVGTTTIMNGTDKYVLFNNAGVLGNEPPAALVRVNDTNVTLTLGGAPSTALLAATSLTMGWTGTLAVSRGGIGTGTLTAHAVLLGEGTSTLGFATIGTAGRLLIDQGAAADPSFNAMSGDATITLAGAITVAKVNGVSYGASPSTNTVPVVTSANTVTYEAVPNVALANSTISGVALGNNLFALTFGAHLTAGGASYNGSAAVTITSDATNANTASTIVARDASGNFSAGSISAQLNGVTYPSSYTSGGIAYASGTGTVASSALMTLNGVIYGGGAGASPLVTAQGGANTVLIANSGAPSFSATPVIGTSVTTPIHYGGSAAGSTLTLQSTSSGSPSGDSVSIKQGGNSLITLLGGNVGLGTETNPGAPFVFSTNTATGQGAAVGASEQFQFIAADGGAGTNIAIISYGGNTTNFFYKSNGTSGSPTKILNGNFLGLFGFVGYDGTTALSAASSSARVAAAASQDFTNVNHGTYVEIDATVNGGSRAQAMRLQAGVIIGTGTIDPGAGSLSVGAQIFAPNMTQTSTAVTGTVCWTTGTGAFTIDTTTTCLLSAERYKHDFRPLDETIDSLALVLKANPGSFYYNDDVGIMGEQIGFRAEEIAQLDVRLVSHIPDGRVQSVRYQQYTAVLTRAIQKLNAKMEQIERGVL